MQNISRIICTFLAILSVVASIGLLAIWSVSVTSVIDQETFWIDPRSGAWIILFFGCFLSLIAIALSENFMPKWRWSSTASHILFFVIAFPALSAYMGIGEKHMRVTDPQLLVMCLISVITFAAGLWIHRALKDPTSEDRIPSFSFWHENKTANSKIMESPISHDEEMSETKSRAIFEVHGELYWEWKETLPIEEYKALLLDEKTTLNELLKDETLGREELEWIRMALRNIDEHLNRTGEYVKTVR